MTNLAGALPSSSSGTHAPGAWRFSWPLLVGLYVFGIGLYDGHFLQVMLVDGDSYWHVAAGRWIFEHHAVPATDPFSHTMRGAPWTAQEWLSELLLAGAHAMGGWNAVVALTSAAFALTFALLTSGLLRVFAPLRALLIVCVGVMMAVSHLLARPFILAMPLLMIWAIELFRAADEERPPNLWFLPLMTLWANMHGGFTLGVALTFAVAGEAVLNAWRTPRRREAIRGWGVFVFATLACALVTPHGVHGLLYTWQVLAQDTYALDHIGEWASPNFHRWQPLHVWLIGAFALLFLQGLRLPVARVVMLLGLLHLSLKHVRNVELLGLIAPLIVAKSFQSQWSARAGAKVASGRDDAFLERFAAGSGPRALGATLVAASCIAYVLGRVQPAIPPAEAFPGRAIEAARAAHLNGPVLNDYGWGGALIYSGIPPFIDGRSDLYRDAFLQRTFEALNLETPRGLPSLLDDYRIRWTLLRKGTPAIALLDCLPGWHRIYEDDNAVIHARDATP